MTRTMEVVGEDGEVYEVPVNGAVLGSVMGDYDSVEGPRRRPGLRVAHPAPRRAAVPVKRPGWRDGELAPGVIAPDEGMIPLPLIGSAGVVTFSATVTQITFVGQVQQPFRPERLLVSTSRTGTSATGRLMGQIFVGTKIQAANINQIDLEQYGAGTAFGVRLTMQPLTPGVFVQIPVTLSTPLTSTDTIYVAISISGRSVL